MTRRMIPAITALVLAALLGGASLMQAGSREATAFNTESLIRLHVVANSDSEQDQKNKLEVRDAILSSMESRLAGFETSSRAYEFLQMNEALLHEAISSAAAGAYRIEFGTFEFPDRVYGEKFVPAGRYRAVRVLLGEAKGQNWWCVLFPPMCFKDLTQKQVPESIPTAAAAASQVKGKAGASVLASEDDMSKVKREYRLKIIDWASRQREEIMARMGKTEPRAAVTR